MSWFQLDPQSIAERAQAHPSAENVPSLSSSLWRGAIGFTIVSVAGFVPWAIFGRWFHRMVGEIGMYVACGVVFVCLSGVLLHRLIMGSGSLPRFYKLFGLSFAVYAVGWIAGWMVLRGHPGSLTGLLLGTAAMGWMMTRAFDAREATLKIIAMLFLSNTLGYFVGGWVEAGVAGMKEVSFFGAAVPKKTQIRTAMLLWGVFYGIGFGTGLGWAFYRCQERARSILAARSVSPTGR